MYLLPLLFSNLHLGLDPFASQEPTLGRTSLFSSEDLISPFDRYFPIGFDRGVPEFYHRPGSWLNKQHVTSSTSIDDDGIKFTVNLQRYKPEEITVKVVDDYRWVIVEAKLEKQDQGSIVSRNIVKRFSLPNRADVDQITSTISSDGVLIITVPLKPQEVKVIKIEQTGQPAVSSNNEKEAGASETTVSSNSQKEAGASETAVEKKAEDNEMIREKVTATQAQETGPKPEK